MIHRYFRVADGRIIKTVGELPKLFMMMPQEVFEEHVNEHKNDFSSWIEHAFGMEELAEKVSNATDKQAMMRIIRAHLKHSMQASENNPGIKYAFTKKPAQKKKKVKFVPKDSPTSNKPSDGPSSEKGKPKKTIIFRQDPKDHPEKNDSNEKPEKDQSNNGSNNESIDDKNTVKPSPKQPVSASHPTDELSHKPTSTTFVLKKPASQQQRVHDTGKKVPQSNTADTASLTDADKYFEKNPIIIDQRVDLKRKEFHDGTMEMIGPTDLPLEKQIEFFKDHYQKVYDRLSDMRKKGFNTKLAQIMLERVPAKIKYMEASQDIKDGVVVKRYLNEAIDELNMQVQNV